MPWDRVHDEAEVLEHYISEELEERIAAALGDPDRDPHGDPIPDRELSIGERRSTASPLSSSSPGSEGTFVRVSDGVPEMLRYPRRARRSCRASSCGCRAASRSAAPLTVEIAGSEHAIGADLAARMLIVGRRAGERRPTGAPPEPRQTHDADGLDVEVVLPGEAAVAEAARRSLEGGAAGLARLWPFLGPAFIAAVAYIDPGNFATNIAGGAQFGYLLLWVVLAANLIAMLVQTQSAKLGIATGKNLAELCREQLLAPDLARALAPGRGRRDGDRHRRGRRRRARPLPPVRDPALPGRR